MQDWREHAWTPFGRQLGDLLRNMVVMTFPQKYALDASGQLQQLIQEAEEQAAMEAPAQAPRLTATGVAVAGLAALAMFALTIRRSYYSVVAGDAKSASEFERQPLDLVSDLEQAIAE